MEVAIVGGGICGLATALLLDADGHRVTVFEQDANPIPEDPRSAWDDWIRKGVGQFRQPHLLQPALRVVLEREFPAVEQMLIDAGAIYLDLTQPLPASFRDQIEAFADHQFWCYSTRRPMAEWAFRKAVDKNPRIAIARGAPITALVPGKTENGVLEVNGVVPKDGDPVRAELVVDASGRASRSPQWLADIGAPAPIEEKSDSKFTYFTRYFTGTMPAITTPLNVHYPTISILVLPGDNDTWSVTLCVSAADRDLRALKHPEVWTRVVAAHPAQAGWLNGEPISDIVIMTGALDRYRRFVVDGKPVALGFVAVADAWACTNPNAGRGISTGVKHAVCLRDAIREAGEDRAALARIFDAKTESTVAPWFRDQAMVDMQRFSNVEAERLGTVVQRTISAKEAAYSKMLALMGSDATMYKAGLAYICGLNHLEEIFAQEDVAAKLKSTPAIDPATMRGMFPGPTREELLHFAEADASIA